MNLEGVAGSESDNDTDHTEDADSRRNKSKRRRLAKPPPSPSSSSPSKVKEKKKKKHKDKSRKHSHRKRHSDNDNGSTSAADNPTAVSPADAGVGAANQIAAATTTPTLGPAIATTLAGDSGAEDDDHDHAMTKKPPRTEKKRKSKSHRRRSHHRRHKYMSDSDDDSVAKPVVDAPTTSGTDNVVVVVVESKKDDDKARSKTALMAPTAAIDANATPSGHLPSSSLSSGIVSNQVTANASQRDHVASAKTEVVGNGPATTTTTTTTTSVANSAAQNVNGMSPMAAAKSVFVPPAPAATLMTNWALQTLLPNYSSAQQNGDTRASTTLHETEAAHFVKTTMAQLLRDHPKLPMPMILDMTTFIQLLKRTATSSSSVDDTKVPADALVGIKFDGKRALLLQFNEHLFLLTITLDGNQHVFTPREVRLDSRIAQGVSADARAVHCLDGELLPQDDHDAFIAHDVICRNNVSVVKELTSERLKIVREIVEGWCLSGGGGTGSTSMGAATPTSTAATHLRPVRVMPKQFVLFAHLDTLLRQLRPMRSSSVAAAAAAAAPMQPQNQSHSTTGSNSVGDASASDAVVVDPWLHGQAEWSGSVRPDVASEFRCPTDGLVVLLCKAHYFQSQTLFKIKSKALLDVDLRADHLFYRDDFVRRQDFMMQAGLGPSSCVDILHLEADSMSEDMYQKLSNMVQQHIGPVVQCAWKHDRLVPLQIRTDKKRPNSLLVVLKTILQQASELTLEMIVREARAQKQWLAAPVATATTSSSR